MYDFYIIVRIKYYNYMITYMMVRIKYDQLNNDTYMINNSDMENKQQHIFEKIIYEILYNT